MSDVAVSVGAAQEAAALAALPPSEKWWNPSTNQVERLDTSPQYKSLNAHTSAEYNDLKFRAEADTRAARAREAFIEREGYDRLGGTQEEFNPAEFETAPSTPVRAGPGLAVSPSTAAIGTAMGIGMVAGAAGLALANQEPLQRKNVRPGIVSGPSPPDLPPLPPTPELSPSPPPGNPGVVEDIVYNSLPQVGWATPQAWSRRRGRRKSLFRKFL